MTTMTQTAHVGGHLELLPIDEDAWRLCDRRVSARDAEFVVAYIERTDDGFETVWMRGGARRARLSSLEECVERGERILCEQERSTASRPIPIAHFPPARGF
ncbi:hypothetical protein RM52_04360 [Microbacterium hominis]|uniref:Uncharacterized protein n=2 Tax=Microbacteriaceae TaxID=85023 RepID=A0A0B4D4H5_9MICO|nr:hypothetical protein RM52_04360 [Microbacterium hominis]